MATDLQLVEIHSVTEHEGIAWCLAWDAQGKRLASCGQDKTILIWSYDPEDHSLSLTDKLCGGHSKTIRSVCFAPDGRRLAAASFDGTVSIWKHSPSSSEPQGTGSGQWSCIANLEGHENEVKCVTWSPDGRLLATSGRDKTVWIWESSMDDDDFECLAVMADHSQDVKHVKWHPNEPILASTSYDESIRLWTSDPLEDDWFATAALNGHMSTVWATDFDAFGNHLVSAGDDNSLVIWRRQFGPNRLPIKYEPVQRLWNAHHRPIYTVSWYSGGLEWDEFDEEDTANWPERMLIASGSADKSISIWSASFLPKTEGEPKFPLYKLSDFELLSRVDPAHSTEINCVAWNPKKPVLASCDDSGQIKLWSLN